MAKEVRDDNVHFEECRKVLPAVLKKLDADQKPDVHVLLFQGSLKEAEARIDAFSAAQVVLCLSEEDEPSAEPKKIGDTLVVSVGHKGKYVGVVGFNRTGDAKHPFALRYQLVSLGEQYKTPEDKEAGHPIMELMENYTKQLRDGKYLLKYGQGKHKLQVDYPEATFVGSAKCKSCHKEAYKIWEKTPHAQAYKTLVESKHPSLRQYDGECIVCHVVGFALQGGFTDERRTPHLENVGCESCHGPGSLHVASPQDVKLQEAMNTWKPLPGETEEKRVNRVDQFCQKCHDIDNDVHWKNFQPKWTLIAH